MSDLVEDFLAREKDGLAGLENEIPSAFDGNCCLQFSFAIYQGKFILAQNDDGLRNNPSDGFNDGQDSFGGGKIAETFSVILDAAGKFAESDFPQIVTSLPCSLFTFSVLLFSWHLLLERNRTYLGCHKPESIIVYVIEIQSFCIIFDLEHFSQ